MGKCHYWINAKKPIKTAVIYKDVLKRQSQKQFAFFRVRVIMKNGVLNLDSQYTQNHYKYN